MSENKNVDSGELDDLVKMIDGKMESGISRLGVSFSDKKEPGSVSETHFHGKKDSWNPGVWGERHGER